MKEELKQKARESSIKACKKNCCISQPSYEAGYIAGATENSLQLHDLQKNPEDLPQCAENKRILFYVKEWLENVQHYHNHYCLGFYKNAFLYDDVKVFVEKSKGYENEHLPQTVLFWTELPQFTGFTGE